MPLTGNWTLAALSALALTALVATVLLWNRVRSWLRWPVRGGLILGCQLTGVVLVAALVNDAGQFYGSWGELFGHGAGVSIVRAAPAVQDRRLAGVIRREKRAGRSLIVTVYVPEAGGVRADPALVYLPAAYFSPSYAGARFPVVELFQGFPASARTWVGALKLQQVLDGEIAAHRAVPFVAVVPTQNYAGHLHDAECLNAVGGIQAETTLITNVQKVIDHTFRVDRTEWAAMGYSTGGFCALNAGMRYPSVYRAVVSMSGNVSPYIDRSTGAVFGHSVSAEHDNDPLWRARHLAGPPISVLLAAPRGDPSAWRDAQTLGAAFRSPTRVSMLLLPQGGHSFTVWRAMEPVAFDWLSRLLPTPLGQPVLAEGRGVVPYQVHPAGPASKVPLLQARGHRAKPTRPKFQ
ncbi:MAG TPA: alpha/beta hydrolase-fold protein [Jatrophihabitantaceae bacterium]|jgi:enterochelin esterase-like enzyme